MIFTGRSVEALDDIRGGGEDNNNKTVHRQLSAVSIATGWFSSLRRPARKSKKSSTYQKQAKSAWDLTALSLASTVCVDTNIFLKIIISSF